MFGRLFGKKKEEKTQDDLKLEQSLQKTRSGIIGRLGSIFQENEITPELWEELEDILIMGDVGTTTSQELLTATGPDEYRAHIGHLLESPETGAEIGRAARQRVIARYSWEAHMAGIDRYIAHTASRTG